MKIKAYEVIKRDIIELELKFTDKFNELLDVIITTGIMLDYTFDVNFYDGKMLNLVLDLNYPSKNLSQIVINFNGHINLSYNLSILYEKETFQLMHVILYKENSEVKEVNGLIEKVELEKFMNILYHMMEMFRME